MPGHPRHTRKLLRLQGGSVMSFVEGEKEGKKERKEVRLGVAGRPFRTWKWRKKILEVIDVCVCTAMVDDDRCCRRDIWSQGV